MFGRINPDVNLTEQQLLKHKLVQEAFQDPRYRHLQNFGNYDSDEPERVNYDRAMTMQALVAVYTIRSAETQARAMLLATWGLVFATVGLFVATIVLVVVTTRF